MRGLAQYSIEVEPPADIELQFFNTFPAQSMLTIVQGKRRGGNI